MGNRSKPYSPVRGERTPARNRSPSRCGSGLHCTVEMNHRRAVFQPVGGGGPAAGAARGAPQEAATRDRQYWLRILGKLADPVLSNLAAGTLRSEERRVRTQD